MSDTAVPLPARVDLDALFRRYHRELTACAYRRLKDRDAAADVVQDAFVRYLHREVGGTALPEALSPGFFLKCVVRNLTIDVVRQNRRRGRSVAIDDVADTLADAAPSAEQQLAARQEYELLKRALDELPSAARAALLLSRVEGLTHAEIGRQLGVSGSMVSKHIMAALRHCLSRVTRPAR